jgi:hypothetical protein
MRRLPSDASERSARTKEIIMSRVRTVAAIVVAVASLAGAPAHATTSEGCSATIAQLQQATVDAVSLSDRTEVALVNKAVSADEKLSEGKIIDSLLKLEDYQAALDALATPEKPKITSSDYQTLSDARQLATDCVTAQLPTG